MLREDNFCVSCSVSYASQFNAEQFMRTARTVLPSLNEKDSYIRSGLFIHPEARDFVSSFKCCGSSTADGSRIEVLQLQLTGMLDSASFDAATEFVCRHLLENSCDAAFVSFTPASGKGWRTALVRSPRFCSFEIPQDIVRYMIEKLLRVYLAKNCQLTEAELDVCFPKEGSLVDDTQLKDKARIIDAALKTMRFCDPAVGNGQLANALVNAVVSRRLRLNKFFTHKMERTEEKFFRNALENSLCATDCDPGIVETFKLEMRLNMPDAALDGRIVWGNVLLEDLFGRKRFHAVISDPPHMKQDYFFFIKKELANYKADSQNADIYCYYAERSFDLLESGGIAMLLTSNRWMRADYGRGLRGFLASKNVLEIVDYGNIPALDGSNMSMSLFTAENSPASGNPVRFVSTDTERSITDLLSFAEENAGSLDLSALSSKRWKLAPASVSSLLDKLQSIGIPLEEYAGKKKLFRGILTGCNKAFTMEREKAEKLIEKDAKYAEILKPFLSGRNVKRYAKPVVKKYLICIPRGFTDAHRNGADPEEWFAENYFDAALHLSSFQNIAEHRRDQGDYWWELRSFKHYEALSEPKIICPTIVSKVSATMDLDGLYSNDKTSVIIGEDYYLLGILNSRVMDFWFRQRAGELLNGYYELKPADIARVPVVKVSLTRKSSVKLRDEIAECAKRLLKIYAGGSKTLLPEQRDAAFETERRLNACVNKLYRLTTAEIKITENF